MALQSWAPSATASAPRCVFPRSPLRSLLLSPYLSSPTESPVDAALSPQYVVRHYKSGIKVGYLAHPSFVTEEELAAIQGPLAISAAETDAIFPSDKRHKSEEILKDTGHPYQINLFSGVDHGFAVRGRQEEKVERFAKEQAFLQAVTWFDAWLL